MHSWGLREELESISENTPSNCLRSLYTGAVATKTVAVDISDHPDWGTNRNVLIKLLEKRENDAGAEITFNINVVEVEDGDEKASITLQNGRKIEADLVLAADGIRSCIRSHILRDVSESTEPLLSDITLYGVEIAEQDMLGVPELERLKDDVYINVYMGHDAFVVSRYNSKLKKHGCLFGIKGSTDQRSLWDEKGDIDYVRDFFKGSCPELRGVLDLAKSCDRWRLAELRDLPRWSSKKGRTALLGDSAVSAQECPRAVPTANRSSARYASKRSSGVLADRGGHWRIGLPHITKSACNREPG